MGAIRVLLAIIVVLAHSPFRGGAVGVGGKGAVEVFFMISGFLIHHVLVNGSSYSSVTKFYANRALRIVPLYFALLFPSLLACMIANQNFKLFYSGADPYWAFLVGLVNITIVGQDWLFFAQNHIPLVNGGIELYKGVAIPQAWTLSIELLFYLLAPFLLLNVKVLVAASLFTLGVKVLLFIVGLGSVDPWSYRFFPAEMVFFLLGALSNRFLLPAVRQIPEVLYSVAVVLGTALVLFVLVWFDGTVIFESIAWPLIVIFIAFCLPFAFDFQSKYLVDKMLGELSYPIYISHMLVVWGVAFVSRKLGFFDDFYITLINVVLAVCFSVTLNIFILRPVEVWRGRIRAA